MRREQNVHSFHAADGIVFALAKTAWHLFHINFFGLTLVSHNPHGDEEEESGSAAEPAQPDTLDKDSTGPAEENPQNGQAWRPWLFIVAGMLTIIMGAGVFFVVKKGTYR